MSFLRINGYTIPVARCDESIVEVGSRSAGLDGTPNVDRQRTKRVWRCETPALQREIATAVKALVLGRGDVWPFDEDLYSHKGRVGTGTGTYDTSAPKYGSGALDASDEAIPLDVVQECRDLTINAWIRLKTAGSLSSHILRLYDGITTGSELVTDSTLDNWTGGVLDDWSKVGTVLEVGSGEDHTGSGTGAACLDGNAGIYQVVAGLTVGRWYRVTCVISRIDGGTLALNDISGGSNFAESYTTTGTKTFDFVALTSSVEIYATHGGTTTEATIDSVSILPVLVADGVNIVHDIGGNTVSLIVSDSSGVSVLLGPSSDLGTSNWHMVSVVLRNNPIGAAEDHIQLYVDGVLVDSEDDTVWPDLSAIDTSLMASDYIDDLAILPYAADVSQLLALYAAGVAMVTLPHVYIDGDIVPEDDFSVEVIGSVSGSTTVRASVNGAWTNNLESIKFTLEEI